MSGRGWRVTDVEYDLQRRTDYVTDRCKPGRCGLGSSSHRRAPVGATFIHRRHALYLWLAVAGTTYYYRVQAIDDGDKGEWSDPSFGGDPRDRRAPARTRINRSGATSLQYE